MGKKSKVDPPDLEAGPEDDDNASSVASSEASSTGSDLSDVKGTTGRETLVLLAVIVTIGVNIGALSMAGSTLVYISGLFSFIGLYAYKTLRGITEVKAMMQTYEAMKKENEKLMQENEALKANVEELAGSTERLQDVEGALDVITKKQGQGVKKFREQVKSQRKLVDKMKENLKATVLQSLLTLVMSSDEDGDNMIDANEQEDLIKKLHAIENVELNEELFRQAFAKVNGSLTAVLDMVKGVVKDENVPLEKRIFIIDGE